LVSVSDCPRRNKALPPKAIKANITTPLLTYKASHCKVEKMGRCENGKADRCYNALYEQPG
jgi:hypothetical protein